MAEPTLIDLLRSNPRGWGSGKPRAPEIAYQDDAGNLYGFDGKIISKWETPEPVAEVEAPSLGRSILNIAESPAKLAYGMVSEPVNALARLGDNFVTEDGSLGLPNPLNPENQTDMTTLLMTGFGSNAFRGAANTPHGARLNVTKSSRNATIFDPPSKPVRPFESDYPSGARADEQGRLTHDIEGRPLTARYVVGRQTDGGADVPFSSSELDALTEAALGTIPQSAPARQLGTDIGRFLTTRDRRSGREEYDILYRNSLGPPQKDRVVAHETGHGIDRLAGNIATGGILQSELKPVYNTLNNPNRQRLPDGTWGDDAASWAKPVTPVTFGYRGDDVGREYLAEAVRAYMADPNYLKTVAPETAKRIREHVNKNSRLNSVIQFNSDTGRPSLLGGAMAAENDDPTLLDLYYGQ